MTAPASRTSPVESGRLLIGAEARAELCHEGPAVCDADQTTAQQQPVCRVSTGKTARSLRQSQVCAE